MARLLVVLSNLDQRELTQFQGRKTVRTDSGSNQFVTLLADSCFHDQACPEYLATH